MSILGYMEQTAIPRTTLPPHYPPFIFGLHERGGEQHMRQAGRLGWVLELAAIGLDGASAPADFSDLAAAGFGVMVRINHGYGSSGTIPHPDRYADFAAACARYVARSRGCHIWIIGNEPNHTDERPDHRPILPNDYARAYQLCRDAIRALPGHAADEVLVAGPAPWNATTAYPGNERGDWVRYFIHVLTMLDDDGCDGFALHTYTHHLDPHQITGDFFHTAPGYRHLRNEFRTYRDFMNAIPDRFRNLPVFITETDPTTRGIGWNPGHNVGWVRAAYREIANWNANPAHQPILALLLYRWPLVPDQPEWSIVNRPGIITDFVQALQATPANDYRLRLPVPTGRPTVHAPGLLLGTDERWRARVTAAAGLNLRSGPSTEHTILRTLPVAADLTVLGEFNDWLYVEVTAVPAPPVPPPDDTPNADLPTHGYVSRLFAQRVQYEEYLPLIIFPGHRFLRNRPELTDAPLAPDAAEQITYDPLTAPWTDQAVANSWNRFGALVTRIADLLQIDAAVAVAVLAMESGGRAFADDGRMLIRFENHIFHHEWGRANQARFDQHFRFDPAQPWQGHQWRRGPDEEWRTFHGNQAAEWEVYEFARTLQPEAALRSISMGAPQIMGFNHARIGYASPQAMFDAFRAGAHAQIIGLFDFVNIEPVRLNALRTRDYLTFATSYNGSGQAAHYAALIQTSVAAFTRLRAPAQPESAATARLPLPPVPGNLAELDPELYAAWKAHILAGFTQNRQMFDRLVEAFMGPYHTTVLLYRLTFAVGLAAFLAAVGLSAYTGQVMFGLVFGGIGVASFLTYFLGRPLRALEENLNFITWLGVLYNSYWTRLVYAMNQETAQTDIAAMTDDFSKQIQELLDKNAAMHRNRPGLR